MRKYGIDRFSVESIETVECPIEANHREMHHIEQHKSYDEDKGYNLTKGGDNGNWEMNKMSIAKRQQTRKDGKRKRHDLSSPLFGVYWDEERDSWRYEIKRDSKMIEIRRGYTKEKDCALARDIKLVDVIKDKTECVMYMNYPERYDAIQTGKLKAPPRRMKRTLKIGTRKWVQWDKTVKQWYMKVKAGVRCVKKGMYALEDEAAVIADYWNVCLGNPLSMLNFPERFDEYKDPAFKLPQTVLQTKKSAPYIYIHFNRGANSYQVDNRAQHIKVFRKVGFKTIADAKTWRDTQYVANELTPPD